MWKWRMDAGHEDWRHQGKINLDFASREDRLLRKTCSVIREIKLNRIMYFKPTTVKNSFGETEWPTDFWTSIVLTEHLSL